MVMRLRYQLPPDERPTPAPPAFVQEDAWWAGAQRSFVAVAIATSVASNALAARLPIGADTEYVPPPAPTIAVEDYWINAVPPSPRSFRVPAPWIGEQHEPGALSGQPPEDYWRNPAAPVPRSFRWPLPWSFEQHEPGALFGQVPEDYWLRLPSTRKDPPPLRPWEPVDDERPTPPPPTIAVEDYWLRLATPGRRGAPLRAWEPVDDELPVVPPAFTPIEDYHYRTHSTGGRFVWPVPLAGGAGGPIVAPPTIVEESVWQSNVAPIGRAFRALQPFGFEQHEPAGSLFGVPVEEYWRSPAPTLGRVPLRAWEPVDDALPIPAAPQLAAEEGFIPQPPSRQTRVKRPWEPAQDELGVAPPAAPAAEDYWLQLRTIKRAIPAPPRFGEAPDERPAPAPPFVDEDYWRNQVKPVAASLRALHPFVFDQHETFVVPPTVPPEEDYWRNPTPPRGLAFRLLQPSAFDQHDIFVVPPTAPPEEDFWLNPAAPVPRSFLVPSTWGWEQNVRPVSAPPVEAYWRNPTAPVPRTFLTPDPWRFEQHFPARLPDFSPDIVDARTISLLVTDARGMILLVADERTMVLRTVIEGEV